MRLRQLLAKDRLAVSVRAIGTSRVCAQRVRRGGHGRIRANAFAESRRDRVNLRELICELLSIGRTFEIKVDAGIDGDDAFGERLRSSHRSGDCSDSNQHDDEA